MGANPVEEHQVINGGGNLTRTRETNEVINEEGETTKAARAKLENTGGEKKRKKRESAKP